MADRIVKVQLSSKSKADLKTLASGTERAKVFSSLLRVFGRRGGRIAGDISTYVSHNLRQTGALAKSIAAREDLIGGLPGVRVGIFSGPSLAYAGVQEFGTQGKNPESPYPTIKPKNAKALAMPVGEALTPAGVPRYQSPRQYPQELDFVPFKSKGKAIGALYEKRDLAKERKAARREDRGFSLRNLEAAYVLLKEVDIQPHEFLDDGMKNGLPALAEDVGDEIVRLMRSVP